MTKFNAGDQVRVRHAYPSPVLRRGDRGVVLDRNGSYLRVRFSMGVTHVHESQIEIES